MNNAGNVGHVAVTNHAKANPGNMVYSKTFRIVGIFQILLGTLSIFTWCYALAFTVSQNNIETFTYISAGVWCGIFFLVAGILASLSSVNPNNCKIVGGLVISILSAIFAASMVGIEIAGAVYSSSTGIYRYTGGYYCFYCYNFFGSNFWQQQRRGVGMSTLHGFMAFFAFAELVIAILHSVYCCKHRSLPGMASTQVSVQYTSNYQQPMSQQFPGPNTGHPAGVPVATTYPAAGHAPYQNYPPHVFANQHQVMQ